MCVELEMHRAGKTYAEIARELKTTRNAVAGKVFRARNPSPKVARKKGFRDPELAKRQAELADVLSLTVAARILGISISHLCRIRQRVKAEGLAEDRPPRPAL